MCKALAYASVAPYHGERTITPPKTELVNDLLGRIVAHDKFVHVLDFQYDHDDEEVVAPVTPRPSLPKPNSSGPKSSFGLPNQIPKSFLSGYSFFGTDEQVEDFSDYDDAAVLAYSTTIAANCVDRMEEKGVKISNVVSKSRPKPNEMGYSFFGVEDSTIDMAENDMLNSIIGVDDGSEYGYSFFGI